VPDRLERIMKVAMVIVLLHTPGAAQTGQGSAVGRVQFELDDPANGIKKGDPADHAWVEARDTRHDPSGKHKPPPTKTRSDGHYKLIQLPTSDLDITGCLVLKKVFYRALPVPVSILQAGADNPVPTLRLTSMGGANKDLPCGPPPPPSHPRGGPGLSHPMPQPLLTFLDPSSFFPSQARDRRLAPRVPLSLTYVS
jgi:hypothetical protein